MGRSKELWFWLYGDDNDDEEIDDLLICQADDGLPFDHLRDDHNDMVPF